MKNIPTIIPEMPNGAPSPVPGKKMQKGRQPASANGLDVISSPAVPIAPVAFHRLLQDSLRVHDQIGIRPAPLAVDGQDQESASGKAQLTPPGGAQGLLPPAGTKSRLVKGRLLSASGVKGKTGNMISGEESLTAGPNVAVSSPNIPILDSNRELAPRPTQETTESHVRLQNASGKSHDHLRAGLRHTGEYSTVPGEKGGPGKDAAMKTSPLPDAPVVAEVSDKLAPVAPGVKTSPLTDASAIVAVAAAPLSSGTESGSGALAPDRLQNASGKSNDHLRAGLRHTGEYSTVPGEKSGPGKDATMKTSPLSDASAVAEVSDKLAPVAPGVKTSPLTDASAIVAVAAAPLSSGTESGSGALAPDRLQNASGKSHDHLRAGLRHTGEYSTVPGEKGGPGKDAAMKTSPLPDAPVVAEVSDKLAPVAPGVKTSPLTDASAIVAVAAAPLSSGTESGSGALAPDRLQYVSGKIQDHLRPSDASPLLSTPAEGSGKRAPIVPGEKAPLLSGAATVPAVNAALISVGSDGEKGILSAGLLHNVSEKMQNHVRSGRRDAGEYSAVPGKKGGPGKNAAIVEMEGTAKAVHADAADAVTRGVHGVETTYNEENMGGADGSPLLSSFKENLDEHLRQSVAGEKTSLLFGASAVPAVDAASISAVGYDNGEGALSPGRQALLMADIIDNARPLVQQGGGRVRISLTPPNLGALEIEVRVKKEGVELFVVANNSDVQQTLCSNVDQLRKALVDQGLNMDRFQVVVGDRSDGQQGRDPRQEGMSGGHRDAWSEKGYLPGLSGDTVSDEMGKSARSGSYSSLGAINLFI